MASKQPVNLERLNDPYCPKCYTYYVNYGTPEKACKCPTATIEDHGRKR